MERPTRHPLIEFAWITDRAARLRSIIRRFSGAWTSHHGRPLSSRSGSSGRPRQRPASRREGSCLRERGSISKGDGDPAAASKDTCLLPDPESFATTHAWVRHIPFAFSLVSVLHPKVVLN